MDPALVVWFVVILNINGVGETVLVDEKVPSIGVCVGKEVDTLQRYARVRAEKGWEVSVECHLSKPEEKPS